MGCGDDDKGYPKRVRLVRNRIRCTLCNTVLESKSVHDFQSCPCGTFTDGGLEYLRRGGPDLSAIEDLSEYKETK